MKYKKVRNNVGRTMYYKEGKLITEADAPEEVRKSEIYGNYLDIPDEITAITEEESVDPSKACIFCGQYAKYGRFIHGRSVPLCDEDLNNKSTGMVGAKVREIYG